MAEYVNREMFLSQMGLVGDETKYGNRDAEHSNRSYSTWMGYEIMGSIDDCVEEDVVKVVRCKDCDYRIFDEVCQEYYCNSAYGMNGAIEDDSFCSYGERKDNGA